MNVIDLRLHKYQTCSLLHQTAYQTAVIRMEMSAQHIGDIRHLNPLSLNGFIKRRQHSGIAGIDKEVGRGSFKKEGVGWAVCKCKDHNESLT